MLKLRKLHSRSCKMHGELTPRWKNHFMRMCMLVSEMSKDPSTKVGSVIVRPNRTICSTGYNGFPIGCNDDPEMYENREVKLQRIIHAEMNALCHSDESVRGYTLFSWPMPPCTRCMPHIIQQGITRLVVPSITPTDRWYSSASYATVMAIEAGLKIDIWDVI